ncbi:HEPN domain-containing protein [Pedobacter sp. ASV1-7]|uniref:HEPN domain-containing protein n=1 Tax=Pedobacter sp. ASV1-7 TaxID=3145237 RepID=UPI0032E8A165
MKIPIPNQTLLTDDPQLQEIALKITDQITVDRIYFFQFQYKKISFPELIILIPRSAKQHLTEAKPLANVILSRYQNYKFRMFHTHEVRDALNQGSMVFSNICRPENLIYRQTESPIDAVIYELNYQTVQNNTTTKFNKELKKVADFREGTKFYWDCKNYPLSAFMLHQSLELSYRAAEILIVGKERASHCLRSHQKYLSHYAQEFNLVFNEKKEEDMELVDLLNDAYSAVRHKNTYQITQNQLALLVDKASAMDILITELYQLISEQFTQDFILNENPDNSESIDIKTMPHKDITIENLKITLNKIEMMIKNVLQ